MAKTVAVVREHEVDQQKRILYIIMLPHLQWATSKALQPVIMPPGEMMARSGQPAMQPGTIVYVEHPLGGNNTTYYNIVGIAESSRVLQGVPPPIGDESWWSKYPELLKAITTDRDPPVEQTTEVNQTQNENGVTVHENSGKPYNLSNFFGFGANLADKQFNRINVSNLKQIPTALASASSILGSGFSLPGTSFSLGNLLNLISDNDMKDLEKTLDPQILQMLITYLNNIVNVNDDNGLRCDIDTFIANIIAELKLIKTPGELYELFDRIENDETLRGLDLVRDLEVVFETAFGNVTQKISANGNISQTSSDGVQQALSAFSSLLSGSMPSLNGALFSNFDNLSEVLQRLTPDIQKKLKSTLEKIKDAPSSGPF